MPFRLKRTVRLAAINAGVLAIGLLAAELIFGGWIGENRGTLVIPRDFSRRFDVSGLYRRDQPLIEFHRDKYGLRGDYRDPSRIGILTVGGSTTNEIFISEGETWSDRLAAEFTAAGTPISVVNAGVDGQSTVGIQKNFELWFPTVLAMHADYVLAYVGINEHAVMESGYLNKQDHLLAQRRVFKQYLMNNSALYTLYRNIRGMIAARRAKLIHVQRSYDGTQWIAADPQPDVAAYEAANADKLARYGETVTRLARAIRDFGAEPIFVTQHRGSYRRVDGKVYVGPGPDGRVDLSHFIGIAAVNETTMKVCRQVKAICIDLAAKINFVDGDHYDGLHTTPVGSAKIAKRLFNELQGVLIFHSVGKPPR